MFLPMPDLKDNKNKQDVQEIYNVKQFNRALYYLVKWEGWPSEYDLWEPAEHLENTPNRVKEFEKKIAKKRKRRRAAQEDNNTSNSSSMFNKEDDPPDLLIEAPTTNLPTTDPPPL